MQGDYIKLNREADVGKISSKISSFIICFTKISFGGIISAILE